ncbi:hypothetical protein RM550_14215 [Streptomyces sp. DSM 41527]|uniref:Uncharacterized protein n=1 Tax=Streptomyces mooreae TaxID=3075523 RepID=A0ABU2T6N6_9ACTN|nr:hypothetical protein [Streptomyces sp. DSM 41527]MDT0456879.1 hypothetical protein [Streptomyces sp. DSM 41527]
MQIVDRNHEGLLVADICGQPVQPVKHGEVPAGGAFGNHSLQYDRGLTRGAGQDALPVFHRHPCKERLEELPHHSEGEVALEFRSSRAGHLKTGGNRDPFGFGQQTGFSDSGRTLDHHGFSMAATGRLHRSPQSLELAASLVQPSHMRHTFQYA